MVFGAMDAGKFWVIPTGESVEALNTRGTQIASGEAPRPGSWAKE